MSESEIIPSTIVDLMRHGEPVGGKMYRGQRDDPLSETGWTQMRAAVGNHCPWQEIVSSPLRRCAEFAQELAGRHRLIAKLDHRFKEIGFGVWEGKTAQAIRAEDSGILERFITDPLYNMPDGAESLAAFRERVVAGWDEILQHNPGRHILVIAHAGVIRMVLHHVLEMPLERFFRIQVGNASLTRIRIDIFGDRLWPRLIFHDGRLEES